MVNEDVRQGKVIDHEIADSSCVVIITPVVVESLIVLAIEPISEMGPESPHKWFIKRVYFD